MISNDHIGFKSLKHQPPPPASLMRSRHEKKGWTCKPGLLTNTINFGEPCIKIMSHPDVETKIHKLSKILIKIPVWIQCSLQSPDTVCCQVGTKICLKFPQSNQPHPQFPIIRQCIKSYCAPGHNLCVLQHICHFHRNYDQS